MKRHYSNLVTEPPIYWQFDSLSNQNVSYDHDDSNGDNCHYNLNGIDENESKKIFDSIISKNLSICGRKSIYQNDEIKNLLDIGEVKINTF